ncbi:TPA: hypothetical protein DCR49_03160 [Candidatus Delongbacteria bacterium]|nr:MAG: hypothetical protein A2Y39_05900 [Candidatus Delongbacteria bacterium GWF2_40_14]HAQ60987.1 hypothetical protein [Candidatus Delongbacteria bacterium]
MADKFTELRKDNPVFIYDSFTKTYSDRCLKLKFRFIQSADIIFEPEIIYRDCLISQADLNSIDSAVFNLGMIELISYYKACCSPYIIVKCGSLNENQINFWKKIYFNGLGEFLYKNRIETTENDLFEIHCENKNNFPPSEIYLNDECLIPVGGGKDSIVSLEIFSGMNCLPLVLNPKKSQTDSVLNSGYSSFFHVERSIDRLLLELNSKGYLNGHTPFSALLAFISALSALVTGKKNIILSNENSASVGNAFFSGIEINHQYSKSFKAEKAVHDYIAAYIHKDINYFSILRPVNELKIAQMFSKYKNHFKTFRSCNAGSKTNIWCNNCPKCLFTYIILSPFLSHDDMLDIFGEDLFNNRDLEKTFFELTGLSGVKPFECVGTKEEVNSALAKTISNYKNTDLSYLLKIFQERNLQKMDLYLDQFDVILNEYNNENLLTEKFKNILIKSL